MAKRTERTILKLKKKSVKSSIFVSTPFNVALSFGMVVSISNYFNYSMQVLPFVVNMGTFSNLRFQTVHVQHVGQCRLHKLHSATEDLRGTVHDKCMNVNCCHFDFFLLICSILEIKKQTQLKFLFFELAFQEKRTSSRNPGSEHSLQYQFCIQ